jgi:hypothetical protein
MATANLPEPSEIKEEYKEEILTTIAETTPKLSPLKDGMSVLWIAERNQNIIKIPLNKTYASFEKKFELSLHYISLELAERKAMVQVVEFDSTQKKVFHGIPFKVTFSEKQNLEEFIRDFNFKINQHSGGKLKTASVLPVLELNRDLKIKLKVGRTESGNVLGINFKEPHQNTLNFLDFSNEITTNQTTRNVFSTLSHIIVNCNIVGDSIVGGKKEPLLAVIGPNQNRSTHYAPVTLERFSEIQIQLLDENGHLIPTARDKVFVFLHFREVGK